MAKRLSKDALLPRRSTRARHIPRRFVQDADLKAQFAALFSTLATTTKNALYALLSHMAKVEPHEPTTLESALLQDDAKQWKAGCDTEFGSLEGNKTWSLVNRPTDKRKILPGKWVFKRKRNAHGSVTRHKARWVVKGYNQVYGIDYNETFASVVKPMSYKALFAVAASQDYEIEQMDVTTAFLYGEVEEEIYVEQPDGYDDGTGRVCKLNKALYGLKQSPRVWYGTLASFLTSVGYAPLDSDQAVFHKDKTFIAIYVDDLLIMRPDMAEIQQLKKQLSKRFKMSDLGAAAYYLGMEIKRDRTNRRIRLSQCSYLEQAIVSPDSWNAPAPLTPMNSTPLSLATGGYEASAEFKTRYQSAVGTLMYAMLGTRPDIAYAVSTVSRFSKNPDDNHIKAVNRIFCYLRGTIGLCLVYENNLQPIKGFADANWGADLDTRRSTTGFVFDIGSGAISWSSKRQTTVAISTCEAEYQA